MVPDPRRLSCHAIEQVTRSEIVQTPPIKSAAGQGLYGLEVFQKPNGALNQYWTRNVGESSGLIFRRS